MVINMQKFLWADVETTGLDPIKNAIHQVAGQIVILGEVVDEFDLKMRPHNGAEIEPDALAKTFPGMSFEEAKAELMARPLSSGQAYKELDKILCKHVDKYNKQDKMVFCAYNANFDAQHVNAWYNKNGNKYFFGLCHGGAYFDPLLLALLYEMKMGRRIFNPDRKLATVCEHFNVPLEKAHDALHDIRATRKVGQILWRLIQK